ncbi:MAG: Druantia anti-phage system protein DruA [Pyrinomonadaceae bacterium]
MGRWASGVSRSDTERAPLQRRYPQVPFTNSAGDGQGLQRKSNCQRIGATLERGALRVAWKMAARDRWIGWSNEQRLRNPQLVVNNSRFLILPWVRVRYLASSMLFVRRVAH